MYFFIFKEVGQFIVEVAVLVISVSDVLFVVFGILDASVSRFNVSWWVVQPVVPGRTFFVCILNRLIIFLFRRKTNTMFRRKTGFYISV